MEFFNRDKPENDNIQISQSIIDFMNQNASEEPTDKDLEDLKTRRSRNHLNLNLAEKNYNNLTKEERLGLNKLRNNPHIVIKKQIRAQL